MSLHNILPTFRENVAVAPLVVEDETLLYLGTLGTEELSLNRRSETSATQIR